MLCRTNPKIESNHLTKLVKCRSQLVKLVEELERHIEIVQTQQQIINKLQAQPRIISMEYEKRIQELEQLNEALAYKVQNITQENTTLLNKIKNMTEHQPNLATIYLDLDIDEVKQTISRVTGIIDNKALSVPIETHENSDCASDYEEIELEISFLKQPNLKSCF